MSSSLHTFLLRIKTLFRKGRMDREMAEELEFHQTMLREKLAGQGVPKSEVNNAARQTFGDAGRWHERLRELWQFRGLENLLRDISFSARMLKKSPGFTTVALLTLAIGVGANTAIFSLINGLLLRPLAGSPLRTIGRAPHARGRSHTQLQLPRPILSRIGTSAGDLLPCFCL